MANLLGFMEVLDSWGNWLMPEAGFTSAAFWQLALGLVLLLILSRVFSGRPRLSPVERYSPPIWCRRNLGFIIWWAVVALLFFLVSSVTNYDSGVLRLFSYLGACWILIGVACSLLRERFWAESCAGVGYMVTGLFGLALVEDSIALLEQISFQVGSFKVTAWGILAGLIAFAVTLWISLAIARIMEKQIENVPRLSGSLKVLLAKIIRIILIVIAIVVAVSSMGVDLSALTVLGGAIGLGIGFGLQKVISNFISGIILLMDNSIKPGDVIEIDNTYGWINNLQARYVSVITRDGTEHLIPNEDLITQHVINWSYTDNLVRVRIPIGVAYGSDPHHCIQVILQAAAAVDRVLKDPNPACQLIGFGDSSVDLELRIWISDPVNGIGSVRSQVLLKIWDLFKEHKIVIPFPQRDLHIRSSQIIPVSRTHSDPD